ncbi:hypothetical protein [Streptomyces gilvosporeus]|nr:hypothetical protein [Streptomyces gilvosporeus]
MSERLRFVERTLAAMPAMPVRYLGTCLSCQERSPDTADPDEAQLWCLQHAGTTGDSGYELSAFLYFNAITIDPAAAPPER